MPLTNPRRLTGYSDAQYGREAPYSDALDGVEPSAEEYDDEEEEDHEDDASSVTSELSIPDANIDFSLVYALHTFVATVEGQASVVKGDALTLLDDSNSYWWLIKVLKTSEVGYIPAENIETPYERLARLNSHRNAELTWQENGAEVTVNPKTGLTSKEKKRVTMARGVKFQAQLILSTSDDEDLEEEYEEWQEDMRSETDTDFDSDEDIYEIDGSDQMHHHAYQVGPYPRQVHSDLVIKNQVDAPDTKSTVSVATQAEIMEPEIVPTINKQTPVVMAAGESPKGTTAAADIDTRRASPYKPGLDLDQDETIKISLTPSIARDDEYGSAKSDDSSYRQRKSNKLDKPVSNSEEVRRSEEQKEQKDGGRDDGKEKKGGFKRFFSRGKDGKDKKKKSSSSYGDTRRSSDTETSSINSQSTGYSDHPKTSIDQSAQDYQPTPLRIYAGNIQFATPYKTINVYPSTTAAELVERAVDTFDIQDSGDLVDGHLDFYICIKGVDGDEYTLIPQDKPLLIFNTLTAHLNTPMPSLKKARRISQLMSMGEPNMGNHAHIGGPKGGSNSDNLSEIKLYLNRKVKRVDERDGKLHIKVVHLTNKNQQQEETKIIAVAPHALTGDIIMHALERFKVSNAYAFDFGDDDEVYDLDRKDVPYTLSISIQDQVTEIPAKDKILSAFRGSMSEFYQKRNSTNPDRSSTTSNIATPSGGETFFILQQHGADHTAAKHHVSEQGVNVDKEHEHHSHHARHQLVRQNTPAMLDVSKSKLDSSIPPQTKANDQRTRLLESLAINEDISDDSDREEQHEHRLMESPIAVQATTVPESLPKQEENVIEKQPSNRSSEDDDIMSQLNKVLDDFGRSDYQSPPLASPVPDERSISSFSQASDYSQESYRDEEKQQVSQKGAPSQSKTKVSRSASTVRKAHQSMMFSDNFGLEALMTLVRGDAEYADALEQNKSSNEKNDRELLNRKSLEEIRIQISKELYGEELSQLDSLDKTLDQIMINAIRLFP